jgi:hypothetical protein
MTSPKKNKESATVLDTLARMDQDSIPKRTSKGSSKRSEGKTEKPERREKSVEKPKKSEPKKSEPKNLRTSLTDMLVIDDDDSDDEPRRGSKDNCMTVSTMDSMQKGKDKSGTKRSSKRGSKKPAPSLGSTLGSLGGKKKDFGRHADDNDTFCGEAEPKSSSSAKNTKIAAPLMQPKKKSMASPFMMPSNDDSDSDEEDLFEDFSGASNNPFRKP